jgi:hypothetical protein
MQRQFLATLAVLVSSPIVFGAAGAQAQSPQAPMPNPQLSSSATARKAVSPAVAANYGKLPLSFEANQGQADSRVRFISRGSGYSLFLTDTAAVLALSKPEPGKQEALRPKAPAANPTALKKARLAIAAKTDVISMELAGAARSSRVAGDDQLRGTANYFLGNDPAKWRTNIPTYAKVKYSEVYPGVDLVYYGNQRQLEYDFLIAPGASAKPVKLRFAGASKLKLNADGDLTVVAKNGEIAFRKPVAYQEKDGRRQPVAGQFTLLARNTVGFKLGDYDRSRELVIDPVLGYSTYISSSVTKTTLFSPVKPAIDAQGNAYVVLGSQYDIPLFPPTLHAYTYGSEGVEILKLNPAGTAVLYTAAMGGGGFDEPAAIAVDSSGSAYITGATEGGFPVTPGAFQTSRDGFTSAFVTKLNPSGSALVYSTYLTGIANTSGNAIAVDGSGDAYVAGYTSSTDFPVTSGAFQTTDKSLNPFGASTGFVSKLNPTGSALIYSTFLGGSGGDLLYAVGDTVDAIAIDPAGDAFVAGATASSDFPVTAGAYLTSNEYLGFAAKLNAAGSALLYSTYFPYGGLQFGQGSGFAVDAAGNLYTGGRTPSFQQGVATVKATPGAFQQTLPSSASGYVSKLNAAGTAVVYTTYFGGSKQSSVNDLAVDEAGDIYATGATFDDDFPVTPDAYQSVNSAAANFESNAFFSELDSTGSKLLYSTYLGGSGGDVFPTFGDAGTGVALDTLGNAYVIGVAESPHFPVTNGAFQTQSLSVSDTAFVSKFAFHGATATTVAPDGSPEPVGAKVTFTAFSASIQDDTIPYGEVQFILDGATVGSSLLDDTGHATYSTSSLTTGTHAIQATFIGSATHAASTGTGSVTIVGQTATPNFVPVAGTYRTATTVTIADATAGAVIHYTTDGSTPGLGSPVYSAPIALKATTTLKAIALAAGQSQSATGSGTYTFAASAHATSISLTSSLAEVTAGQPISLTATVKTADSTTATGTVTFLHGVVVIGAAPLVKGVATLTTSTLSVGSHSITAQYGGNATEAVSGSPAVVVEVNP